MTPIPARTALDAYFLEGRCRLLDLAAILDRVERGNGSAEITADPRFVRLLAGIALLQEPGANRAAAVQELFSLPYDPEWVRPLPREA